jgi:nucleotide-binding universal stress UspA family protein
MFQHLLVPLDGGELSERAATVSLELARKLGAKVTGFISEPLPPLPNMATNMALYNRDADEHKRKSEAHAQAVLNRFAERAAAAGVPFEAHFTTADAVDDAIIAAAQQHGCDLIVMVTHGRGAFGELLFGSHTKTVIARSKLPVLVLH